MRKGNTKPRTTSKATPALNRFSVSSPTDGYALNVTVLYEDEETRQWAMETHQRVASVAGPEGLKTTWWRISDLSQPGVLAGAVSTAMRADVLIVASHAAEGLPLPFYVWVEQWMPHRLQPAGALIALLPKKQKGDSRAGRLEEYLRAAARQSRLDFLVKEYRAGAELVNLDRFAQATTLSFPQ
jgi:hypothetical protein